jgi:cytochrome c oxidase assembly protein subunit 15
MLISKGLPLITKSSLNPHANVGKWVLGTAGMVVGMIHVGGVTRLTESGLSMTTWTPLGSLPPITREQWEDEFARYKDYPEWSQRKSMTLDEFQYIYFWEYSHRMLGRCIGLVFLLPYAYFTMRGRIPAGYHPKLIGLGCMGGAQGLVGWWMVKSGLGDDRRGDSHQIKVKPVRLTTHLTMAVATYSALLWTGWSVLSLPHNTSALLDSVKGDALKQVARLRVGSLALSGLTAVTIVSGALVAGNDAGRAFNTFPLMDGQWVPRGMWELSPWSRNLIENTATVQWNHRVLGTSTAVSAVGLAAMGLLKHQAMLTPQARVGCYAVGLAASGQFALGVTTLLTHVPIPLAAAHQLGSLVVLTSSLYLAHSLRYARPALTRAAVAASRAMA